jgi:hypothetical protein
MDNSILVSAIGYTFMLRGWKTVGLLHAESFDILLGTEVVSGKRFCLLSPASAFD